MDKKISETERAAMSALGASLDQTDAVLAELTALRTRLAEAEGLLGQVVHHADVTLPYYKEFGFGAMQLIAPIKAFLTPTPSDKVPHD